MKDPNVIDAEFEVIRGSRPQKARRRWYFDWRNFLIIAALSVAPLLRDCGGS